jgi:ParB family transcriptional regulator, chromosome partitioning protein
METVELYLKDIHEDNEFNCRGKVAPLDVHDLIEDIRKVGLLQPVVVRKYSDERKAATGYPYGLVAGYRRAVACKAIGLEKIPATIKYNLSDTEARLANLGENLIRKDLNIMQEALAIEKLRVSMTMEDIGKRLHKSTGWVQLRCMVLNFPKDIQEECGKGTISQNHIATLSTLNKPHLIDELYNQVKSIKNKRLRGEKGLIIKKPLSTNTKKARKPSEINNCLDHIYDALGPSFATRCLAWCAGTISTNELIRDIKKEAEEAGRSYQEPIEDF